MKKITIETKPLMDVRDDFVHSVAKVIHEATMMTDVIKALIDLDQFSPQVKDTLAKRNVALRKAIYGD